MLAEVKTATVVGLEGHLVDVEVDIVSAFRLCPRLATRVNNG